MFRVAGKKNTKSLKERKLAAAAKAIQSARATSINYRRGLAPPRTGGFWGGVGGRVSEKKVIDTAASYYNANTTGAVTLLNGCVQGNDFNQRDGRKIKMVSVQFSGDFLYNASGGDDAGVRLAIIYDTQANASAPAITDVFTAINAHTFVNLNNRDRFRIIYDKRVCLGRYSTTATQSVADNTSRHIQKWIPLKGLETVYNSGNAGTVADIQTGALYALTMGDSTNGSPSYYGTFRVRFYD